MNSHPDDAIARAQVERSKILEECFQLLYRISKKASCLKLLGLAQAHLQMLADYKLNRGKCHTSGRP